MKSFYNYFMMLVVLTAILTYYIPIRYQTSYPRDIGPQFDPRIRTTYIDVLNLQQPDIFLLGDSMLEPALDETVFAENMGKKTFMISLPGTASTIWYLMIKNNIVVADYKPKYLVVFFRDTMMTVPSYRVTGRYFEQIDEFAGPKDEVLIERAYLNQMNPFEKLMERYLPIYGSRWGVRQSIDYYIRYFLVRVMLGCGTDCMDNAMNTTFDNLNIDPIFLSNAIATADDYLYSREVLNFDRQIGSSFLPEIIRLCRENDIQLILVRMPILRFEETGMEPPGLKHYLQNLAGYLENNKVVYLDFDDSKMYPPALFSDTVHLNNQGRIVFTRQLSKSLGFVQK
jgi:hypothetical protein